MPETNRKPFLQARGITKRYPGVAALQDVELTVFPGEVLAVVGENGAGKSTLMKILAGVERPDAGTISLNGRPVEIDSVATALRLGIALIHQELNLADNLDVAANIFLGREPHRFGFLDRKRMRAEAQRLLQQLELDVSPDQRVADLSVGRQQMVEIAKALSVRARLLIMDEPTSSLSHREVEALFRFIDRLRRQQVSIIYISHRLAEVERLADRVCVLRDGRNAGELHKGQIDHERMVRLMVGRDLSQFYQRLPHQPGPPALEVVGLRTTAYPEHAVSFSLRAGEVVGLAGLVGAGRSELLETLFGVRPALAGRVRVAGRPVRIGSPADAIAAGLALVPEDRQQQGLLLDMTVRENLTLVRLPWDARWGFRNGRAERDVATRLVDDLRIKTPSLRQAVRYLSGGNQQKVVLGKWLAVRPRVLLLDEPTRGIDVGAKEEIYRLMERLAQQGVAVLFATSEMEELLGMSDRVLVLHEGRLAGELSREELSEEAVVRLATGGGDAGRRNDGTTDERGPDEPQ